jgi:hypothetical protein
MTHTASFMIGFQLKTTNRTILFEVVYIQLKMKRSFDGIKKAGTVDENDLSGG